MRYVTPVTAPCLSTSAMSMMPLICAADLFTLFALSDLKDLKDLKDRVT